MNDQVNGNPGGQEPMLLELDLGGISAGALRLLMMGNPEDSFVRDVLEANRARTEILEIIRVHPNTPEELRAIASEAASLPVPVPRELEEARREEQERDEQPEKEKVRTLFQEIKHMKVGERMLLAMRGGQEVRAILLKDTNKEIVRMVLQNPKLTEGEVEMIAKNRNVSDDVLRIVCKNREWMKNYAIVHGLVTNPKTPAGLAAGLVSRISKNDLRLISQSRGVSEVVRSAAKRALAPKGKRD